MWKYYILISWLLFYFPVSFASAIQEAIVTQKSNFLIILADDLGFSDVGSYGG